MTRGHAVSHVSKSNQRPTRQSPLIASDNDHDPSAMALDGSVVGAWKQVVAILDLMEELALQMKKALLECRMVIVDGKFM